MEHTTNGSARGGRERPPYRPLWGSEMRRGSLIGGGYYGIVGSLAGSRARTGGERGIMLEAIDGVTGRAAELRLIRPSHVVQARQPFAIGSRERRGGSSPSRQVRR